MVRIRFWMALLAFAAIGIGTFQPMYLRIFTMNAPGMAAAFTELPYRRLSGLRRLLGEVAQRTPPGAPIAIFAPFREWEGGYGYAFRRAPYLLPGKRVYPMLEPDRDQPTQRYLGQVDYVACWRDCPPLPGFVPLWRSADGELLVRRR